jgi:predicted HD phosphohydrolase
MTTIRRTSFKTFAESKQEDWDIIVPGLLRTQDLVADHLIGQLRGLRHDHGGFPVDRLEHTLQTATRAQRDGRDDEYVVCALVHDIGDVLAPFNHAAMGAAMVKGLASEANHWMLEHHGIFQGYYFWDYIGLDSKARDAYRESPYFEYTEEFCAKYDQTAFDTDYRSEPLEHFEPLLRSFFAARR